MKDILLDTNAYAAFKQGQADAVTIIQLADRITLTSIVLGELLAGFTIGTQEAKNRTELQQFIQSRRVRVVPVDDLTADHYAHIYRALRDKGRPIPTNDMWIAASAAQHGCLLFSHDAHFQNIETLVVGANPVDLGLT